MLTRNLWTEKSFCNGSVGVIQGIVYKQGDQPPALPNAVIVKLDSTSTWHSFLSDIPRCVSLISETKRVRFVWFFTCKVANTGNEYR